MGLLDDAIREHLELKRLSGADPGVVAREEQDALGPVPRRSEQVREGQEDGEPESPNAGGSFFPDGEPDPDTGVSVAGQETVEINMEAELDAVANPEREAQAPGSKRAESVDPGTEDSLEWEVPNDRPGEPADSSGLDGEGDPDTEDTHETGEHIEDVLEETPDFLRETPEQERLWFEQRPPRDFDFNE
ncbi:MAG TPA: hypothetical protein VK781_03115 [Solirubrobacteraceae bacterium]|jgi:hypothetical protein|nr:hypothetical protein [Solirubrobacteraceae bacterium]